MMRQKSKVKHTHTQVSPLTDGLLTGGFFFLIAYSLFAFYYSSPGHIDVPIFLAFCVLVFGAIQSTEFICAHFFRDYVSKKLLTTGPTPDPLGHKASYTKFVATAWQFVIHFTMTIAEAYLLWDEPWLSNPHTSFIPVSQKPSNLLHLLYILQIAIWIMTCFSHRFNSDAHAHKDYVLMYIHHLATIALVALSFHNDQHRIGLVILFIHDCSDIGVDLLKLSNYLMLDGPSGFFMTELSYAFAIIMWIYMRLYYFAYYVIWNGTVWAMDLRRLSIHGDPSALSTLLDDPVGYQNLWNVGMTCCTLLISLWLMHVWWFFLLGRIAVRMVLQEDKATIAHEEYEGDFEHLDHKNEKNNKNDIKTIENNNDDNNKEKVGDNTRKRSKKVD